jgi:hypothetical protein
VTLCAQMLPLVSCFVVHIVIPLSFSRYKANFLRVKQFAMFGSPEDGTVNPWSTSLFGFYVSDGETLTDMTQQPVRVCV